MVHYVNMTVLTMRSLLNKTHRFNGVTSMKTTIKSELLASGRIIVTVARGDISMSDFVYKEADINTVLPVLIENFNAKIALLDKVNAAIKGMV